MNQATHKTIDADLVVIGGGGAGMVAALIAVEIGTYCGREHSEISARQLIRSIPALVNG
jgi:hypothetical protein